MSNIEFQFVDKSELLKVHKLLVKLNKKTPADLLKIRLKEMFDLNNYSCVAAYLDGKMIGICGLWLSMRHYSGKSWEPDHVYIEESAQGKGIGKKMFEWIELQAIERNIESIELNTYTTNRKSHKFYYNLGYEIYGYHFVKIVRKDGRFY